MDFSAALRAGRLVAVIRGKDPEASFRTVMALAEEGVRLIEVSRCTDRPTRQPRRTDAPTRHPCCADSPRRPAAPAPYSWAMPRYEYRCRSCETTFEVSRPMAESSAPAPCPEGHADTVKLLSAVAVGGTAAAPAPSGGGGGGCCGGGCCG